MYSGKELLTALVVPSGNRPKILEAIDATFDDVAAFVGLCVKIRWSATKRATTQARILRVSAFWTHTSDFPGAQKSSVFPRSIGFIQTQDPWPFARPPAS